MAFLIGSSDQSNVYPVAAVRDGIVFPSTENVLVFGRQKSINAINEATKKGKKIVLVMQKNPSLDDPTKDQIYHVGVLATIEKTVVGEKGEINALVKGKEKVKIVDFTKDNEYFEAKIQVIEEKFVNDEETQAMVRYISSQVKKAINYGKTVDFVFLMNILNVTSPQDFSNQIAIVLDLKSDERQELLEENDLKTRLKK